MKYAHINEDTGKLLGWYSKEIHETIPTPNVEVTDTKWQEALSVNANFYEDGNFIAKDLRTKAELFSYLTKLTISRRKQAYLSRTDPLLNEARIKRLLGEEDLATALEVEALEERLLIQSEYPFPVE